MTNSGNSFRKLPEKPDSNIYKNTPELFALLIVVLFLSIASLKTDVCVLFDCIYDRDKKYL